MSRSNNSIETVNAAAAAIATTESRILQITAAAQERRRKSWFSSYWCFGSPKNSKRISHAISIPAPPIHATSAPAANPNPNPNSSHQTLTLTLTFPFAVPPSSPASFLQSDPPSLSLSPACPTPLSAPRSAFIVGPYAHETQLVTPPAFSALTTEPSTAPLTPPPEAVHLTTPSSPEVPFARLLSSDPPRQLAAVTVPLPPIVDLNHRVSFELTAEDVARCLERRSTSTSTATVTEYTVQVSRERCHELSENLRHSMSLPFSSNSNNKEFKFENSEKREAESDWWAHESSEPRKSWSFFPMIEPGVG